MIYIDVLFMRFATQTVINLNHAFALVFLRMKPLQHILLQHLSFSKIVRYPKADLYLHTFYVCESTREADFMGQIHHRLSLLPFRLPMTASMCAADSDLNGR